MGDIAAITYFTTWMRVLVDRLPGADADDPDGSEVRRCRGDAGMTTETVIIIAGLAVLALLVIGLITTKVMDKASRIKTD